MQKKNDGVKVTEKQAKKAWDSNKKDAEELLNDEKKMNSFLNQLESKFSAVSGLAEKLKDIPLIVELVRAYIKKEYTEIPVGSIIGLVSALIYFVSPVDLIPDVIPVIGYVDDAMVIALAIRFAYTDLEDFKKWKANQEEKAETEKAVELEKQETQEAEQEQDTSTEEV